MTFVLPPAALARLVATGALDSLWLFGSCARGDERPDSDVDLAALFARRLSAGEMADLIGDLATLLRRPVDLVDLERAPPLLAYEVLREGRLLYDERPEHRVAFATPLPTIVEDLRIVRRPIDAALQERLRGWSPRSS